MMKQLIVGSVIACAAILNTLAGESRFIKLYDSGRYDEAAKELDNADLKDPAAVCRAGVMYYNGLGVQLDQERGKNYLESAMAGGDTSSAIKLAKVYFHKEKNLARAAYCLLVAENSKDRVVYEEAARLKIRLGDDYKKGVELYIQQVHAAMKSAMETLKAKSAEHEKETAALRQQIADMDQEKRGSDSQLAEFKDKLIKAERARKQIEERVDGLKTSNADLRRKADEQAIASDEKLKYELGQATKRYEAAKAEHDKFVREKYDVLVARNKEFIGKYQRLVAEHEELERQYRNLKAKYEAAESEGSLFIVGMGRGLATLIMSPLNYIRGLSYVQNVSKGWETDGAESGLAKIFAIPMIVFETVPFVADVIDGALDVVSFGYYGDWLYGDGKNSPWWFERDDKVFPWIQKAEGK